ncbi:MAG TPA: PilN domain-containing protein [Gaiellaceae bacterium]|nr:PilN domain-containing protein [Gaiellaceae bacterium]
MRAVNLLPREARGGRSVTAQNLPAVVGGGLGFVVVAALAAGYLSASSKVASAQKDLTAAQTQLAATPAPPPPKAEPNTSPTAAVAQQGPMLTAVSTALSQRIAWDRVLREFSFVLPSDVWLSSVAMTAPTGSGTNGFTVVGETSSYESVARMLSRMYLVPDLTGVTLSSVAGAGNLVSFSINASVKGAAAPPAPAPAPAPAPTDTTSTDSGATS